MLSVFKTSRDDWFGDLKNNLFAGLVVSIAVIPEVAGFAIISGVNPITALFGSAIMLLVVSFTTGRPGLVTSAAGTMALVMAPLVRNYGMEYMILATLITGVIQIVLSYLNFHRVMRFVPQSVMAGFVNALGIIIFMAQVTQLPGQTMKTYAFVALGIVLMVVLPRFIKSVPPALIIVVLMTIYVVVVPGGADGLKTINDLGDMSGALGSFGLNIPPLTWETFQIVLPYSFWLVIVGLTEALFTTPLIDDMTETSSDSKQEVKAQGFANIAAGLFGAPAGCAMVGQSVINVQSGGTRRSSTLIGGISLLLLLVIFTDIMVQIPMAALIGIMIVVSFETFNWESLKMVHKDTKEDAFVMIVTVVAIVWTDNLGIGVLLGAVLAALIFMVQLADIKIDEIDGIHYVLSPLYFGSTNSFKEYFANVQDAVIRIDFSQTQVVDESAIEAIAEVIKNANDHDQRIELVQLTAQNQHLLSHELLIDHV